MTSIVKKIQDLQPGQHFMTATKGMRGHFAVEMWMNNESKKLGVFPEPWNSDASTFATREEAVAHAKVLAEMEGIPYID